MPKEKPKKASFLSLNPSEFAEMLKVALDNVAENLGQPQQNSWRTHLQEGGITMLQEIETTEKGITEVEHDWENAEVDPAEAYMKCKIVGLQTIGPLCFLGVTAGGDWETPVFSIFYFDENKDLRAYIPKKGNIFNFIAKSAFGNNPDTDYKASMLAYKKRYEEIESFNDDKMREDIRLHFGIKKGVINSAITEENSTAAQQKKFRMVTESTNPNYESVVWEVDDLKDGITFIETVLADKQCNVTITAN